MLLYKDIISDDEMFSDAFPMFVASLICILQCFLPFQSLLTECADSKVVDDIVYEVECLLITVKAGADIDIGELFVQSVSMTSSSISRCQSLRRGDRRGS